MNKSKEILKNSWKYVLVLLLVLVPLFQYLDSQTIRLWDESRLAINAYEMYNSGNYLVPTFNGVPDMWNTKPPLMLWFQVFFMKLFGVNELAVRLPSALAALFTCIILMLVAVRYLKNFWLGFICTLVLVTSAGYTGYHAARTGDYDALLTFFSTLGCFSFFIFLETSKKKYLYLFFVSLVLAVLTKSAAILMLLPGLFIYTLIKKKLLFLLKDYHFYIGLLLFVGIAGGYYLLREMYNPGYLSAVWANELGGRFLEVTEEHVGSFWFYFQNLIDYRFEKWTFLVPCGIFAGFFIKDIKIRKLTLFSTLMAVSFFLVISSAQTKLPWYDLPMFPFLAILAGIFIYFIFSFLEKKVTSVRYRIFCIIPCIFLIIVFILPYKQIINKTYFPKGYPGGWEMEYEGMSYYLRDILHGKIEKDNFTIIYDGVFTEVKFYYNLLNDQGKNITRKDWGAIKPGEIVFLSQNETIAFLEANYNFNIVDEYYNFKIYEILEKK